MFEPINTNNCYGIRKTTNLLVLEEIRDFKMNNISGRNGKCNFLARQMIIL